MKTETIRFRVALFDSAVQPYTITADNEAQEQVCMQDQRFVVWLTDWQQANYTTKRKP